MDNPPDSQPVRHRPRCSRRALLGRLGRGALALSAVTGPGAVRAAGCPAVLAHRYPPLMADQPVSLCDHAGKVVLVVNTASRCGYTPQYEGLEALWRRYRERGLVVLAFPANDFGAQEPGTGRQIADFCKVNYGVSFPVFEKLTVPIARDPLFAGLAAASGQAPAWNFHKYLIDRQGQVSSFRSAVEPSSPQLVARIEKALVAR